MKKLNVLYVAYRDWAKKMLDINYVPENVNITRISTTEELLQVNHSKYDILFFIGWSEIIPDDIVNNNLCICMHPSPLPKYRGGSPIQHQILNNETDSAVTFFIMNSKLDSGDIIWQDDLKLTGNLIYIFKRIITCGMYGILDIIDMVNNNTLNDYRIPQDESQSTIYKRRKPKDSEITIEEITNNSAEYLYNKIRSLQDPYPNAYITCKDGSKLYITNSHL